MHCNPQTAGSYAAPPLTAQTVHVAFTKWWEGQLQRMNLQTHLLSSPDDLFESLVFSFRRPHILSCLFMFSSFARFSYRPNQLKSETFSRLLVVDQKLVMISVLCTVGGASSQLGPRIVLL